MVLRAKDCSANCSPQICGKAVSCLLGRHVRLTQHSRTNHQYNPHMLPSLSVSSLIFSFGSQSVSCVSPIIPICIVSSELNIAAQGRVVCPVFSPSLTQQTNHNTPAFTDWELVCLVPPFQILPHSLGNLLAPALLPRLELQSLAWKRRGSQFRGRCRPVLSTANDRFFTSCAAVSGTKEYR